MVLIISDGIVANELVSHGDHQQLCGHALPVEYLVVIKVSPVELCLLYKTLFSSWVGKVAAALWCHGYEYLHHREDTTTEHALVHIAFLLVDGFRHILTRAFQFDMEQWHTIDQQHQIATTIACQWVCCPEMGLAHDLIAALPCTDFLWVEQLQIYFLAKVMNVLLIVAFDNDFLAINALIDLVGCMPLIHLIDDLLHL